MEGGDSIERSCPNFRRPKQPLACGAQKYWQITKKPGWQEFALPPPGSTASTRPLPSSLGTPGVRSSRRARRTTMPADQDRSRFVPPLHERTDNCPSHATLNKARSHCRPTPRGFQGLSAPSHRLTPFFTFSQAPCITRSYVLDFSYVLFIMSLFKCIFEGHTPDKGEGRHAGTFKKQKEPAFRPLPRAIHSINPDS